MKENEKIDKYLDLARVLKKLWNMSVKVTPIVVGAFGTHLRSLEKLETGGIFKTLQTTYSIAEIARILRRVLKT